MSVRIRPLRPGTPPSVSVVIPHYNYGRYLPAAVRSVVEQPGVDLEVIIVDDASNDGSLEVARAMARSDDRVTLVEHRENLRHIATYNDGLSRASGKYLVLLSADDALAPGSLERSTALMEADPSIGLVYGHAQDVSEPPPLDRDPKAWRNARLTWTKWTGEEWIRQICHRGGNLIRNPEVVMRRDLLENLGGYDSTLPHSADMYLWMRAASRMNIGRVNGRVQAFYRLHDSNMHSTLFGGLLDDFVELCATYEKYFTVDGHLLSNPEHLRRNARQSVAREALRWSVLVDEPRQADRLVSFARRAAASDVFTRYVYGSPLATALKPQLRSMEKLRWKVRYHRQLRFGI